MVSSVDSNAPTTPLNGFRLTLSALRHRSDLVVRWLATITLVLLITIVFVNVVARYGFGGGIFWASEAALWLFIYLVFLGIPLAQRDRMHLSITLLVDHLPPPLMRACAFLSDVVVAYTTILLFFATADLMQRIGGASPALQLPLWLRFVMIPLACGLSLLQLGLRDIEERDRAWLPVLAIAIGALLYLGINEAGVVHVPRGDSAAMMVIFIVCLALGVPVTFTMLFAVFAIGFGGGILPPAALVQNVVNGVGKFLLLAVPFFLTAGALMNAGGLTRRLLDFAFSLVGHLRGGHGQVAVVSSLMYAGVSGSSYSEVALGSKLLVPEMVRSGYSRGLSCAIVAAAGILPNIIPPSIALLLMAAVANLSVGALWFAGIGPGIVLAVCLMGCVYLIARFGKHGAANPRVGGRERLRTGLHAIPVLFLAVVIVGGIRVGLVTPTEAGVLAVVYALLLGLLVYREYSVRSLYEVLNRAALESALVGFLIGAATPFAFVIVAEQVPQSVVAAATTLLSEPWVILLLANLVLLAFGMVLDTGAGILILTPILMPLAPQLGMDPIQLGLMIVVNLMIGGLTPPVGMLCFISSAVTGTPVSQVFRAVMPLFFSLLIALVIVTYVPAVSLGLLALFQ